MAMVPFQSSLVSALANEIGTSMRDVDPLEVLKGARTAQRMVRGYLGRKKAMRARRSPKKRKTTTARFAPNRPSTSSSYSIGTDTGLGSECQLGVLQMEALPVPEFSNNSISARDSMLLKVKGYKICRDLHFTTGYDSTLKIGPVEVNWALIQWHCPISDASARALMPEKFFRTSEFVDKKAVQFGQIGSTIDAYPVAGDPWEQKLNCLPMNPDNGYSIITRRKKIIYPQPVDGPSFRHDGSPSCTFKIEYYQKINKIMETEDCDSLRWKSPIYEVFWTNCINQDLHPSNTATESSRIRSNKTHTCYFTSIK